MVAAAYDDSPRGDEDDAVARLADLAGGGPTLELAIGTGRIALPLAATGVRVDGIEQSAAMIAQLRAKPGGQALDVVHGDMADVDVTGQYRLVFVVFNSIFNLLTQDEQVRCFAGVRPAPRCRRPVLGRSGHARLRGSHTGTDLPAGPAVGHRRAGRRLASRPGSGTLRPGNPAHRQEPRHDRRERHPARPDLAPVRMPSELDLMARLAGLRLHSRSGGWRGEPFTATSRRHVSVYGR